jgi:hypothetical protein
MTENYIPKFKGRVEYKCSKCRETILFYIPEENLDITSSDGRVLSKMYPDKIFCPVCMMTWEAENGDRSHSITFMASEASKTCGTMTPGILIPIDDHAVLYSNPNFFLSLKKRKNPIPIYREYTNEFAEYLKFGHFTRLTINASNS